MKVCVVGSGAREHALAEVLGRSAQVVATPGNPGISGESAARHSISSSASPPEEIEADLFVVGPEAPLVDGLADRLRARGRLVFGPGAAGAALEGSKRFMKEIASAAGVPTARWASFRSGETAKAKAFLRDLGGAYVVKTDGLAAGKGVLVTGDLDEAEADVEAKLSGKSFGAAGERIVIEERLGGAELSLFAITDGRRVVPLSPAQDYKRLRIGDLGPNTGGMGAYSPVPAVDDATVSMLVDRIVEPTVSALGARGVDYRGVLFAGIMLGPDGPALVEFNVRFGDPEAQVVLPRLAPDFDLADLLAAAAAGDLANASESPRFASDAAVCVVAAAPGYPGSPKGGGLITGVAEAGTLDGVSVYHAGTRLDEASRLVTAGGRVLCVRALGPDLSDARGRAYEALGRISFPGMQFRADIASAPLTTVPTLERRP